MAGWGFNKTTIIIIMAGAHQHSGTAKPASASRTLVMAPMYLGVLRVWSLRWLAYASALIIADRHDEAANAGRPGLEDTGAANRQFVAALFHKTRSYHEV